jgi:hypothetical protein
VRHNKANGQLSYSTSTSITEQTGSGGAKSITGRWIISGDTSFNGNSSMDFYQIAVQLRNF